MKKKWILTLVSVIVIIIVLGVIVQQLGLIGAPVSGKEKAALIVEAPVAGGGFPLDQYKAFMNVIATSGKFEYTVAESVSPADVVRVVQTLVQQGYKLICTGSSSYTTLLEYAPGLYSEHPEVTITGVFGWVPEEQLPKNLISIDMTNDLPASHWLAGYVSGSLTKLPGSSGKIGIILGVPIPPHVMYANAFTDGAKTANPDVEVMNITTGDFNDIVKASQAADTLISGGADIIIDYLYEAHMGVLKSAQEHAVNGEPPWIIGIHYDKSANDPSRYITCAGENWDPYYKELLKLYDEGVAGKAYYPYYWENTGGCYLSPMWGPMVPQDIAEQANATWPKLLSGEIRLPLEQYFG